MVSKEALLHELTSTQLILLGEVHDNPEHHHLQAEVLKAVIAQGRRPALAMEQFDREFQPAIDAAAAKPGASADSVARSGGSTGKDGCGHFTNPCLHGHRRQTSRGRDEFVPQPTREVAKQGFEYLGESAVHELRYRQDMGTPRGKPL